MPGKKLLQIHLERKKALPPQKRNVFFRTDGRGLLFPDWFRIAQFLFPEDLLNLRASCLMQARLFPFLIPVIVESSISRFSAKLVKFATKKHGMESFDWT